MDAQKASYSIALMAKVLGVTRAGYYACGCGCGCAGGRRVELPPGPRKEPCRWGRPECAGITPWPIFWTTLTTEYYYRRAFTTRDQVYTGVATWIEDFYNRRSIHTSLGGKSPIEYELHQSAWTTAA